MSIEQQSILAELDRLRARVADLEDANAHLRERLDTAQTWLRDTYHALGLWLEDGPGQN